MPVPFLHLIYAVGRASFTPRLEYAGILAQAHCAAHLRERVLIREQRDDGMFGLWIELRAICLSGVQRVPAQLNAQDLHAQAESQIGDLLFPRDMRRDDFPFYPPIAEATGHDDAIRRPQTF